MHPAIQRINEILPLFNPQIQRHNEVNQLLQSHKNEVVRSVQASRRAVLVPTMQENIYPLH